ncbi:MAG TPA: hypothetical protein VJ349_18620 [Stellaceae bacterium]|jgi:hypothetical protein|nr:hypothetical protein [Stellaceae bacterium]
MMITPLLGSPLDHRLNILCGETFDDACEFELTDNEYRKAALAASEKSQRYRILMVQYVFDLGRCRVLELPNPAGIGRGSFKLIGRSSLRMKFELA